MKNLTEVLKALTKMAKDIQENACVQIRFVPVSTIQEGKHDVGVIIKLFGIFQITADQVKELVKNYSAIRFIDWANYVSIDMDINFSKFLVLRNNHLEFSITYKLYEAFMKEHGKPKDILTIYTDGDFNLK